MYPKRILHALLHTKIIHVSLYLDILQDVFYTYPKEVQDTFRIHIRYIKIMYLMRFLGVTLDTYQDTSGYMYLGLFITIHQDTPRYKITIHVSWTRHGAGMGS